MRTIQDYFQPRWLIPLCQSIGMPTEAAAEVADLTEVIDIGPMASHVEAMVSIRTAEKAYKMVSRMLGEDPRGMKMLAVQLATVLRTREFYAQRQISNDIFLATMETFPRFCIEHMESYGQYGFDKGWWTFRHLALNVLRLGVLEFEMKADDGKKRLSVHIPSGSVMTREALDASYSWAREFFAAYFGEFEYDEVFCDSWLLAPALKDMLPANSRILNFQQDYRIVSVNLKDESCIQRIFPQDFHKENLDINMLPEKTSLQRAVKKHLQGGKKIGSAYGVYEG